MYTQTQFASTVSSSNYLSLIEACVVVFGPCKTVMHASTHTQTHTQVLESRLMSVAEFYPLRQFESIDALSTNEKKGEESKRTELKWERKRGTQTKK